MLKTARKELQPVLGWLTVILFALFGDAMLGTPHIALRLLLFIWLLSIVLWGAITVVRHAEALARRLGEPYGTLILTLAVTTIEVSFILSVLLRTDADSSMASDTVYAILMITLNGVAGLCLLLGGLRHREQAYNLQGAQAFLAVIIPVSAISLLMPNFTVSSPGPTLSHLQAAFVAALTILLYAVFLAIQTRRHTSYFKDPDVKPDAHDAADDTQPPAEPAAANPAGGLVFHTVLLLVALFPVTLLADSLGKLFEDGIDAVGAPQALLGVLVAMVVLTPESTGALRAALANKLQRAINVCLGAALATISLTLPSVLIVGVVTDRNLVFGLHRQEMFLLALTLIVSTLTFGGQRTNILQGAVHLVLFCMFAVLIFDP